MSHCARERAVPFTCHFGQLLRPDVWICWGGGVGWGEFDLLWLFTKPLKCWPAVVFGLESSMSDWKR